MAFRERAWRSYGNRWYFDEITSSLRNLGYIVEYQLLNAANYGVPQNRERVIVVGHRGCFRFPKPDARPVSVVDALGNMLQENPVGSKFLTESMDAYVERYEKASSCITPRNLHPHLPARTLTCRNLVDAN